MKKEMKKEMKKTKEKTLTYEQKKEILAGAMSDETLTDPQLLMNIALMLKRFDKLDESIFKNKKVLFKDFLELIDIKLDLKYLLEYMKERLATYYVGCLKSLIQKNTEQSQHMENLYFNLLHLLDLKDMSLILQNIEEIKDIKFLHNSREIIEEINNG